MRASEDGSRVTTHPLLLYSHVVQYLQPSFVPNRRVEVPQHFVRAIGKFVAILLPTNE